MGVLHLRDLNGFESEDNNNNVHVVQQLRIIQQQYVVDRKKVHLLPRFPEKWQPNTQYTAKTRYSFISERQHVRLVERLTAYAVGHTFRF